MAGLYLTCGLCGRKQADGLLSRNYWGHLEDSPHGTLRACPTCKEASGDWADKLVRVATGSEGYSPSPSLQQAG
jgi:hypothetical protein